MYGGPPENFLLFDIRSRDYHFTLVVVRQG